MTMDFLLSRRCALFGALGLTGAGAALGLSQSQRRAVATRSVSGALPVRVETGTSFQNVSLAQVPIGAGGFITGLDISSDGQRFACRTDVANAYIRDKADRFWRPLFSPATMTPKDFDPLPKENKKTDGHGVAGIRIAPSNKNVIFATYLGYVWRTVDGGRTIERTKLQQKRFNTNSGTQRLFNPTIDIHPSNPAMVLVGTWGEGVWFTENGGDTWQQAKLPPATQSLDGQPGLHLVLFDPVEPRRVYVFVTGLGLFSSTEGPGGPFNFLTGGPKYCSNLVMGPEETVLLCEHNRNYGGTQLWRYSPRSEWSFAKPKREPMSVAFQPDLPSTAIVANLDGFFERSGDAGATFTELSQKEWAEGGGEVQWIGGLTSLYSTLR